jgi:hypothetical protein
LSFSLEQSLPTRSDKATCSGGDKNPSLIVLLLPVGAYQNYITA